MSAGRIYDKIDNPSFCAVKFVANDAVIAKVLTKDELIHLQNENPRNEFYNTD